MSRLEKFRQKRELKSDEVTDVGEFGANIECKNLWLSKLLFEKLKKSSNISKKSLKLINKSKHFLPDEF